jgi:hypothetical protein
MKLALIRRQFSATGGAELYAQRLLRTLAERNHELHLFAGSWSKAPDGVTLHPVEISGSRASRPRLFAEAVQNQLVSEKFDCVFSLERTLKQDVIAPATACIASGWNAAANSRRGGKNRSPASARFIKTCNGSKRKRSTRKTRATSS